MFGYASFIYTQEDYVSSCKYMFACVGMYFVHNDNHVNYKKYRIKEQQINELQKTLQ
jgi:hypothetical protein